MYSVMIYLVFLAVVASTHCKEAIQCTLPKSPYCYQNQSLERFRLTLQEPAPMATTFRCQNMNYEKLHLEWTQRRSHLQDVEGYSVEVAGHAFDGTFGYMLSINSSLILQNSLNDETFITFTFDDAPFIPFSYIVVTLYSLPLYNPNDTDYYQLCTLDQNSPPIPLARPKTTSPPSTTSPRTNPTPLTKATPLTDATTPLTKASKSVLSSKLTTTDTGGDISIDTVIIVAATNMATVSLMLICFLSWKRCRRRKRRSTSDSFALSERKTKKANQTSKQNKSILVLTDSEERDDAGPNRDYYKRIALCLANTLRSSGEFNVSCNLWMTENISEKGIAIWAHDVMKANDKVIILCNSNESKKSNDNVYAQMIQNLLKSTEFDDSKFMIICMEDRRSHKCFRKMDLQALKICKRFKLKGNLADMLKALRPGGLERGKVEKMNHAFAQMMAKMDVHHNHGRQDINLHGPVYEVIHENDSTRDPLLTDEQATNLKQKAPSKKRNREFSEASTSERKTDAQYDSLYSSRCNSQSSETGSSGEDRGCFDHGQGKKGIRGCSNPKPTGAKPKKNEMIEDDRV